MKRYISIYLKKTPELFRNMEQHILDEDWEQLRIKAHSLKPQTDYMGVQRLKSILVQMEQKIYEKKFEGLIDLYKKSGNHSCCINASSGRIY